MLRNAGAQGERIGGVGAGQGAHVVAGEDAGQADRGGSGGSGTTALTGAGADAAAAMAAAETRAQAGVADAWIKPLLWMLVTSEDAYNVLSWLVGGEERSAWGSGWLGSRPTLASRRRMGPHERMCSEVPP
eukprot:364888-Chlamydomonas_euryale.AAC.3